MRQVKKSILNLHNRFFLTEIFQKMQERLKRLQGDWSTKSRDQWFVTFDDHQLFYRILWKH
jgi:hypothetical protein